MVVKALWIRHVVLFSSLWLISLPRFSCKGNLRCTHSNGHSCAHEAVAVVYGVDVAVLSPREACSPSRGSCPRWPAALICNAQDVLGGYALAWSDIASPAVRQFMVIPHSSAWLNARAQRAFESNSSYCLLSLSPPPLSLSLSQGTIKNGYLRRSSACGS